MHWFVYHCYSFSHKSWKWGTLKTLVRRAHINCSTEKHQNEELNHIRKTFNEINNYLHWTITKALKEIKEMTLGDKTSIKNHLSVIPYHGEKGIILQWVNHVMNNYVNKILQENVKVQTVFTGNQLSSCFK